MDREMVHADIGVDDVEVFEYGVWAHPFRAHLIECLGSAMLYSEKYARRRAYNLMQLLALLSTGVRVPLGIGSACALRIEGEADPDDSIWDTPEVQEGIPPDVPRSERITWVRENGFTR